MSNAQSTEMAIRIPVPVGVPRAAVEIWLVDVAHDEPEAGILRNGWDGASLWLPADAIARVVAFINEQSNAADEWATEEKRRGDSMAARSRLAESMALTRLMGVIRATGAQS